MGPKIFLTDRTNLMEVLSYTSYKRRRIVRSFLGVETYAFADEFDEEFIIRHELEELTKLKVPLTTIKDSNSPFQAIVKESTTTKEHLMIDVRATREAY